MNLSSKVLLAVLGLAAVSFFAINSVGTDSIQGLTQVSNCAVFD